MKLQVVNFVALPLTIGKNQIVGLSPKLNSCVYVVVNFVAVVVMLPPFIDNVKL